MVCGSSAWIVAFRLTANCGTPYFLCECFLFHRTLSPREKRLLWSKSSMFLTTLECLLIMLLHSLLSLNGNQSEGVAVTERFCYRQIFL